MISTRESKIRLASIEDIEAINYIREDLALTKIYLNQIFGGGLTTFVALQFGLVIGYLTLKAPTAQSSLITAEVEQLFVSSRSQRQGTGTLLLRRATGWRTAWR